MRIWCCWEKQNVLSLFRRQVDSLYSKDMFLKPENLVRFVSFFGLNHCSAVLLVKEMFPSLTSIFWTEDRRNLPLLDSSGVSVTLLGRRELGRFLQDQEVLFLDKTQEREDFISWGLSESTKWEIRNWLFLLRVRFLATGEQTLKIFTFLWNICAQHFFFGEESG